jgi:hypothetical protein
MLEKGFLEGNSLAAAPLPCLSQIGKGNESTNLPSKIQFP